jgi:hypothetical protein
MPYEKLEAPLGPFPAGSFIFRWPPLEIKCQDCTMTWPDLSYDVYIAGHLESGHTVTIKLKESELLRLKGK